MNLDHLKYVVTVAQTKNFSKAAEILFISQPALSQYIKRMENELGVDLFIRDKSKVTITKAGEAFVEYAIQILELNNKLLEKMSTFLSESNDTITIGVSQFYGKYFIPKILPKFKNNYPDISIKIVEAESKILEEYILNSKIDLAIIPLPIQSSNIKYNLVYKEKILFAVNSENKQFKSLINCDYALKTDLSKFKNEPFVLLKKGFKLRELAESICLEYGFTPNVIFEAENMDTLNTLVSDNMGVSFLPDTIYRFDNINYIDFHSKYSFRSIVTAYKTDNHIPIKILNLISVPVKL